MIISSEKDLNKALKTDSFERIYLLFGDDSLLVENYANLIANRALGGADSSFDMDKLDGKKLDIDHLYDSAMTIPVMSSHRCIIVDDPEVDKFTASDLDKIIQIVEETEQGTVIIIPIKQASFSVKKSTKCKKLYELADKNGIVVELKVRTASDLVKQAVKHCAAAGCELTPEDAAYMVGLTTGELSVVNIETDKLIARAGEGKITREMIDALVSPTVESEIFSLSKAILAQNYTRSMQILSNLLYLREPAINILYTLSMAFIDLYRAKLGSGAGAEPKEMADVFGYKGREFAIKNAMRDSAKLKLSFLKRTLDILLDADSKLKGSKIEDDVVLQQAITEIFLLIKEA